MNFRTFTEHVVRDLPAGWAVNSSTADRVILASTAPPVDGFSSNIVIEFLVVPLEPHDVDRTPSTAVVLSRTPLHDGEAAVLMVDDFDGLSITQSIRWSKSERDDATGTIRAVGSARTDQMPDLAPAWEVLDRVLDDAAGTLR